MRSEMPRVLGRKLLSDSARPLRFVSVGFLASAVQLGLFATLIHHGVNPLAGNALAFLISVQVNFALSSTFTWRRADPPGRQRPPPASARFPASRDHSPRQAFDRPMMEAWAP